MAVCCRRRWFHICDQNIGPPKWHVGITFTCMALSSQWYFWYFDRRSLNLVYSDSQMYVPLTSFWSDGDELLATTSADQSIKIWDLSASRPVLRSTLKGHISSVKAVNFRPGSRNQLVSGARKGNILLWDTRVRCYGLQREVDLIYESVHFTSSLQFSFGWFPLIPLEAIFLQPVRRIVAAHIKESPCNGQQRKLEPDHHSVTSVAFLNDTVLASAGASDGTIKLWDLRKTFKFFNVSMFTHGFLFPLWSQISWAKACIPLQGGRPASTSYFRSLQAISIYCFISELFVKKSSSSLRRPVPPEGLEESRPWLWIAPRQSCWHLVRSDLFQVWERLVFNCPKCRGVVFLSDLLC